MALETYSFRCHECGDSKTFELDPFDVARWRAGDLIQNVFPQIPSDDREIMISGTCSPCFDKFFPDGECDVT